MSGSSKIPALLLCLILTIAAWLQFTVVERTTVQTPLTSDAGEYFSYAYNLDRHGVYSKAGALTVRPQQGSPTPDAIRPPGYPLFLLLVGTPQKSDAYLHKVQLVQACLSVFSVLLAYLISTTFGGRHWSLLVAALTSLSPHLAVMNTYLLSETLFCLLLLCAVYGLIQSMRLKKWWGFALTGVAWALCSLVRPTTQFLLPILVVVAWAMPRLKAFRSGAMIGLALFVAVQLPWMLRNSDPAVSRPTSSLMVKALAHGAYPDFMYQGRPETYEYPYRYDPDAVASTRDLPSILRHIAAQFRHHPLTFTKWYLIGKPMYFLAWRNVQGWDILIYPVDRTPYFEDGKFIAIRLLMLIAHWPLMLLALLSCVLVVWRPEWLRLDRTEREAARIVAAVIGYALVFHIVVAPFPRYGVPFRPLFYAMSILPMRALWIQWRNRESVRLY